MTNIEVCDELRSELKPYAAVKMTRHFYGEMVKRIKLGKAKPETVSKFLTRFGYSGDWNNWTKTNTE